MDTILPSPQWPAALANFVTWCLMWDPKNRPTSFEAMNHQYFADAVDPLKQRSRLSQKVQQQQQQPQPQPIQEPVKSVEPPQLTSRSSWFRKSLIGRDSPQPPPQQPKQQQYNPQLISPRPSPPVHQRSVPVLDSAPTIRPVPGKRATWANGPTPTLGAPMPVLPSIRPISPLSSSVTVQAHAHESVKSVQELTSPEKKKLGRQLSVASHGNHYSDNASGHKSGLSSPTSGQKESFFAHLRKRARRLSGRNQGSQTPQYEDVEAQHTTYNITSNRSSMIESIPEQTTSHHSELDKALQRLEHGSEQPRQTNQLHRQASLNLASAAAPRKTGPTSGSNTDVAGPVSSRTRRALHVSHHPTTKYETPDEEDELLDEALHGVQRAMKRMDRQVRYTEALAVKDTNRQSLRSSVSVGSINPYPTPSPSAKRNGILFNQTLMNEPATPMKIVRSRETKEANIMWSTPPYEENEWAANAAASIFAVGSTFR